ncbi:hypothetical protein ACFY3V_38435 [Streptosporangium sp. NPDC000095]|uniref:hypothetical protein n=1 Tax=Streptosporangium sp. NPDC000095 TaxID=3366184 RepID=UPI003698E5DC
MIEKQSAPPRQHQKKASWLTMFLVCSAIASLVLIGGLLFLNRDDSQRTDMSTVLNQIRSGEVLTAKLIEAERRIEITTRDKKRFHSYWGEVGDQGSELTDELQKAELPDGYTVEVPKRWGWFSPLGAGGYQGCTSGCNTGAFKAVQDGPRRPADLH